jgi:eukaryotic-like serine/threonine-protein kinase
MDGRVGLPYLIPGCYGASPTEKPIMEDTPPRLAEALADRYRLERELGSGGMATVYLAHDLRHDRSVAVKVLRPELAAVIGADRFLAEIKTTAALQHPHILPLFDSGQADGFLFYVMPLIEGESLRDRLNREHQLPVEDSVRLAKEIGSALDYAHRHGVIHRDIKPENILLHDGAALVADFGIALAVSHAGGNRMTETGLSLGTPGYMSPEQATGERGLDARSDVYSLGCLLYEMLAGEPPHTGPTVQAVIAAVVTKEPTRLSERRRSVPANIDAAVHKALAKLPADRFASADAFVRAISEPATGATYATVAATAAAPAPAVRSSRRRTLILGGALLLMAVIAASGWLRPRESQFLNRYALFLRSNENVASTAPGGHATISHDGRKIIYVSRGEGTTRLMLKSADQLSPTPLAGTAGATSPFFSPDDRQVGYIKDGRKVLITTLEGGSPLTLTDSANTTAGDWGDDGYVYFESDSGISRIRSTGGHIDHVYNFPKGAHEIGAEWPVVLPGSKGLLFRRRREGQAAADYEIMAMPLPTGTAHVVARGVFATYARSGHLIVVTSDGKLLAIPFSARKLETTGPPIALYEGLETNPFGAGISISDAGTLVYPTASQTAAREVVWVTRDGVVSRVDSAWKVDGTITDLSLSPNGRALAITQGQGGTAAIWVKQLPSGPFSRLTFGDTSFLRPTWTPDGTQLLYLGDRGDGAGNVYIKRADGVGPAKLVLKPRLGMSQVFESTDGQWMILRSSVAEVGNGEIFAVHTGDSVLVPLVTTQARDGFPALSPDGKYLAYSSDESGAFEVYVRPFPNVSEARWQVSTAGGRGPLWSHSGKELFFRNNHNDLVAAQIATSPSFTVQSQKALFPLTGMAFGNEIQPYVVGLDDKKFLMMRETVAAEAGLLIVNEHFVDELTAKARAQK